MSLIYYPDKHLYLLNGEPVPSVNQILRAEGFLPNFNFPAAQRKCRIGSIVHNAIKKYFHGTLDETTIPPDATKYFAGFKAFIAVHTLKKPYEVEKPLYSERWGFAGKPDFWTYSLYDWKCSDTVYDHYYLTMGAYDLLVEEKQGSRPREVILVQLRPYDFKIKRIVPDRQTFLAAALSYRWKKARSHKKSKAPYRAQAAAAAEARRRLWSVNLGRLNIAIA